jgi:hypothetical protein
MQLIHSQGVYSFVLTEDEWYLGSEQQKEAWVVQCKREAQEAKAEYASILVDPNPLMTVAPTDKRHRVWGHTFERAVEVELVADLQVLFKKYEGRLTRKRISYFLMSFASDYSK